MRLAAHIAGSVDHDATKDQHARINPAMRCGAYAHSHAMPEQGNRQAGSCTRTGEEFHDYILVQGPQLGHPPRVDDPPGSSPRTAAIAQKSERGERDTMTALELAQHIGQTGAYLGVPDLVIEVRILDARMSWGKLQVQIQPTRPQHASGSKWVQADSVMVPGLS